MKWEPNSGTTFQVLIRTILSQNTGYKNQEAAYNQLSEKIEINPCSITLTPIQIISGAIKPAGMYNKRAKTIKAISQIVNERYHGDLCQVIAKPYLEARNELMLLPGVGKKTADVTLLFNAGKKVIPIDRHIERISKRLGLVSCSSYYDDIRIILEDSLLPENYLDIHIILIQFGRDTCRALNPKCRECILNDICPSKEIEKKQINNGERKVISTISYRK
jgi:endonuclease-3